MTAQRYLTAFAAANVLGLASANAATLTMSPFPPGHAATLGTLTRCATDRAAGFADPAFSDEPRIAREMGIVGETQIRVDLEPTGRLHSADVLVSSGNRWLDGAALFTARTLRYLPEVRNCAGVAGSYAVIVQFDPAGE